jgi:uroporphyrin-III C-methyltransferase/precorrin-2 dehydrogenase/sirohydrochlorin ferrochelatase
MFYLPLFHRLQGAQCLVVGAGQTAVRKLRWLVRAGAHITVVAPQIDPEIQRMRDAGNLIIERREFYAEAVHADLRLVISATNAPQVSESVFARALDEGVLVNCVDRTELCTIIFPAIIDRLPILVAVSSMGQSPTLSRSVRGWIETRLPQGLGRLAELAGRLRLEVKQSLPDVDARKGYWDAVFSSPAATKAMRGRVDEAVSDAQRMLSQQRAGGEIVLVGAGPGDPDLITLRGLRAIQSADVLMYDKLIDPGLLEYARRDVELVDVGKQGPREDAGAKGWGSAAQQAGSKRPSGTHMQAAINERLIEEALRGKKVVRLKGGDPFIFGRGGEELLAAAQQGFAVEIIPGITAGMAAASYAGIPLTHRHVSQSVRFLTGHRVADAQNLEWSDWARDDQTLVIYMALVSLETIQERLLAAGRSAATPAVLIENATLPSQREVFASLAGLNQSVIKANITGPSIIIVGQAVEIAQQARQLLMQHDVEESTRAN